MASSLEILNAANIQFQRNVPMAILTVTTGQTNLTNSAYTSINFDTTTYDNYGGHSNVTNNTRYTCQVAGWYWWRGAASFNVPNATGNRGVAAYVTNVQQSYVQTLLPANAVANNGVYEASGPIFMNVGDFAEVRAWNSSGVTLSINPGGTNLSLYWLHS